MCTHFQNGKRKKKEFWSVLLCNERFRHNVLAALSSWIVFLSDLVSDSDLVSVDYFVYLFLCCRNLNNNHISALEKGSMSNLTSLETLKMNKNKLVEIMTSAFHDMHKLKVL